MIEMIECARAESAPRGCHTLAVRYPCVRCASALRARCVRHAWFYFVFAIDLLCGRRAFAMVSWRGCSEFAMRLPCVCHAFAMRLPCVCYVFAILRLPRVRQAFAMCLRLCVDARRHRAIALTMGLS